MSTEDRYVLNREPFANGSNPLRKGCNDMHQFLLDKRTGFEARNSGHSYAEHISPFALDTDGCVDKWLDKNTSYIWRVGVVTLQGGDKCDWCTVLCAYQRRPTDAIQFLGKLDFTDGENCDCTNVLLRMLIATGASMHAVFSFDNEELRDAIT